MFCNNLLRNTPWEREREREREREGATSLLQKEKRRSAKSEVFESVISKGKITNLD